MKETPNFAPALGQVLREHREKSGLTRKRLAAAIGGSESHIKAIEVGNRNPTVTVFVLIADSLEIEAAALLREVRQRQAYLNDRDREEETNVSEV